MSLGYQRRVSATPEYQGWPKAGQGTEEQEVQIYSAWQRKTMVCLPESWPGQKPQRF